MVVTFLPVGIRGRNRKTADVADVEPRALSALDEVCKPAACHLSSLRSSNFTLRPLLVCLVTRTLLRAVSVPAFAAFAVFAMFAVFANKRTKAVRSRKDTQVPGDPRAL